MKRFLIRDEAESDTLEAATWYEEQREGLGEEFVRHVREGMNAIKARPESRPTVWEDVRRLILKHFPYAIFYVVDATRVAVIAVLHHRRNPDIWKKRAKRSGP